MKNSKSGLNLFDMPAVIMIVTADPAIADELGNMLRKQGYKICTFANPETALASVNAETPGLVLLDIGISGPDGCFFCQKLKENTQTSHVPVIFMGAVVETREKQSVFDFGGVDYITTPFHASEVLARVKTHVSLNQIQEQSKKRLKKFTHDFNNILSSIFIFADLAIQDIEDPDELKAHIGEILINAQRTRDLINQMSAPIGKAGQKIDSDPIFSNDANQ